MTNPEAVEQLVLLLPKDQLIDRRIDNPRRYKGTRVSVLGIRDLDQWSGADRALAITRSLARLISPFEAKSQFPVTVDVDGHKSSLVAVTDTLLSRAIAEFIFRWQGSAEGKPGLRCEARFRERLFRPAAGTPPAGGGPR